MINTAKVYDFSAAHERRSSRMENQKQGHFALFRSLLSKEWAKDTAKLAMWIRLIGEASYKPRTVEFAGRKWNLMPGELVTTAAIMGRKLRDQDSHEKSPQAVTRMINFFAREGMITTKGTRFGTVITITNYGQYQAISADEPCEEPSDNNKPSGGADLKYVPDEPCEEPSDEQNKKVFNKNNNTPPIPPRGESKKFDPLSIPIPEWLNPQSWAEWITYRSQSKKPIKTALTVTKAFNLLKECFDEGYDPSEVINTSIANGYQGLFKPKGAPRSQRVEEVTPHWNSREGWEDFI